ncbi:hypothetical protein M2163_008177 [Streptomyces sp. SAI-135]|jgi:hypothetical protein|uniref:hypothetical protein n=1 Tax=unclassified Streptomyces TaxID=2593676 RepID=UPI002474ADD9|nr:MULTISPECIES: hypothetical protein [unclassified Streptomyces]MDH6514848.1 hypothetical protein [Streptomyces sp. SAI-090]MDH6547032.1 hypothetical protein [Streptomyces sp. SAI-041]MDH6566144.1 hypothetical protein [Streptomyces sp. SAI-117]MDH6588949.1 hypothetical protein [Streptomyces sp. SAI-133]MDH6621069.1 hypothetical protein [Streptomyces sp. SAI-135]
MPALREFLARWRPSAPPGRAAGGAVPADRTAELTAELEPTLALLDGTAVEAAAIREDAGRRADERRRVAADEAARTVRTARARALRVRSETAARLRAQAVTDARREDAAARRAVRDLRERARARTPELTARMVARVARDLGAEPGREAP